LFVRPGGDSLEAEQRGELWACVDQRALPGSGGEDGIPQPVAEEPAWAWLHRVTLLCRRMRQPHADVIRADADGENDEGVEEVVHRPLPQRNPRGHEDEEPQEKAQYQRRPARGEAES